MVSLAAAQTAQAAQFSQGDFCVPCSFGNDAAAIAAAHQGVALCDRSHWARIQLTGRDRQAFLHNQSTNDVNRLQPGQGCDTTLINSTARTLDLATGYVLDDSVLLLASPQRREFLMQWFDRYIFFGDKVTLTDITATTACFSLIGPGTGMVLAALGLADLADLAELPQNGDCLTHRSGAIAAQPVQIAQGCGLALPGVTLWLEAAGAGVVWQALSQLVANPGAVVPMGCAAWEQLRIRQGRPAVDYELTDDINALEAGLWQTVSFNKGCYIGQETIARLDTYNGVKQQLWGLEVSDAVDAGMLAPGTVLTLGDDKVGFITSVSASGDFALAYIKTKAGGAGLQLQAGDRPVTVVAVPFVAHEKVVQEKA